MNRKLLVATLVASAVLGGTPAVTASEPLPNLRRAAEGLYVGGEPTGDAAFEELARMGVKTLVSVDGMPPDAEAARVRGIAVVHVPLGYDGVSDEECAAFKRIAAESERPLYVHCHHGKHRGPAAAAIIGRAAGLLDDRQGEALLEASGTDPAFRGLWRAVASFDATRHAADGVELREAAPVEPFVLAMAQLGRAWAGLRGAPDRDIFLEAVRESIRFAPEYDPTGEIERGLAALQQTAREHGGGASVAVVESRCVSCHEAWRDGTPEVAVEGTRR